MIMNTREDLPGIVRNGVYFVRWTLISLLMGTVCGLVGTAFGFGVAYSQQFFRENPFMLFLMPVSGILIVLVHKALDQVGNKGTNLILESISLHGADPFFHAALYFYFHHPEPSDRRFRRQRGGGAADRGMHWKYPGRSFSYG